MQLEFYNIEPPKARKIIRPSVRIDNETLNAYLSQNGFSEVTPRRHLPTVIIIGAQKAGTTALRRFLSFHSHIAATIEEQHFFNNDSNFKNGLPGDYEIYRQAMVPSLRHQITVEKTPNYLADYHSPRRIFEYQKFLFYRVKFIVIIREPLRRTISSVFHQVESGLLEVKNLTEVLMEPDNYYVDFSLYGYHMKRWLNYFRHEQFLILDGEEFIVQNPANILQRVEAFLGIPNEFKQEQFGFEPWKRNYYCYKPTHFCFGPERGHESFPQDVTKIGKGILNAKFKRDLRMLAWTTNTNFSWVQDAFH